MGHARFRPLAVLTTALLLLTTIGPPANGGAVPDQDMVLFSLPVGGEITYAGVGDEQLPWGPAGIAISDDGTIWIADGAGYRVLQFSETGRLLSEIDVNETVVGIGDIETAGDIIVVLDIAAVEPEVYIYDQGTGEELGSISVPKSAGLDAGLSGVEVTPTGIVMAELEGGHWLTPIGSLNLDDSVESHGRSKTHNTHLGDVELVPSPSQTLGAGASVQIEDEPVELSVTNLAGSVMLAGVSADSIFVAVDEVSQAADGTLQVDTTVRSFDSSGTYLGAARVPRSVMLIQPTEPVAIGPQGDILALVPREKTVDIVRLSLTTALNPILPRTQEVSALLNQQDAGNAPESCVSRSTMGSTDWSYRNDNEYLSSTNISGSCSGRTKPRYLGSAGAYLSVPYDWGGYDTVAAYDSQMSPGTGKAGNINSSAGLSCSYGVDCSGFVGRVWQKTTKYSTKTLPNISYSISLGSMDDYDLFNKYGSHAMMYRYASGGGYYVSDSTTTSSYDRVVYRWISSSYASGFTTRRFNNVCS